MKRLLRLFIVPILVSLTFSQPAGAYWVWSPESGKFVNPEGAVEDTANEQFDYAVSFYEAKNYDKALDELKNLAKKYPTSRMAPEAYFKMGQIHEENHDFLKAFRSFQKIIDNYPNSTRANEVIERQYRIGNVFLSGKKTKFMGMPVMPALPKAIEVFEQVVKNAPFGEYGDKALFQLGIAYKRSGNLPKAVETFERFVDNYPDSPLAPDAKFQMGEVSLEMSKNMNRSQEGLDRAEDYFDNFLSEYPAANVRGQALRMKKAIDEKNAEKNFKIGEYYERENYLESATIYYQDVMKNYPRTTWAAKARERLELFKSPVKFIKKKEDDLQAESTQISLRKKEIEETLRGLRDEDPRRAPLTNDLKKLKKKEKAIKSSIRSFDRRKVSDLKRRREALKRKSAELKEKKKALEQKRKLYRNNTSEDLQKAFRMWSESLRAEEAALLREKNKLNRIENELGVSTEFHLPFRGQENVENLRGMHADNLSELAREMKLWDLKKEELYDFRSETLTEWDDMRSEDLELLSRKKEFQEILSQQGGDLKQRLESSDRESAALEAMKDRYESRRRDFQRLTGKKSWKRLFKMPGKAVTRSWDLIMFSSTDPAEKLREANERMNGLEKELKEKAGIVEAIQKSFQEELEGRSVPGPVSAEKTAPESETSVLPEEIRLKKKIKLVEREIRWRYEEVEDRGIAKKAKVEELELLVRQVKDHQPVMVQAGRTVAAPAKGFYRFFHAFLFGLEPRERTVRSKSLKAEGLSAEAASSRIRQLREEIEFESIIIEARVREIDALKKDLKELQKEGAGRKGFSYRSVFIERPGTFLEDVVDSARRVFPSEERKEILIDRLDRETRDLEDLRAKKRLLGEKIREIEAEVPAAQAPAEAAPAAKTEASPDIIALEKELSELEKEITGRQKAYREERERLEKDLKVFYEKEFSDRLKERFGITDRAFQDRQKLIDEERKKTEEELLKIVKKEEKIVNKRQELLAEKKEKISKKISDFRKKEDFRYEVLENELDDLLDQVREVQIQKQNLMEEKKKLSESLKTEVTSFEK
ncbi:MAG: outer membrane protein assembly factor BamD [Candidatus Omnitrophica bacterium]|nr:outer membrane protein assembly factor BamD [Candidatus Omnitrophota bacterium]